MHSILGSDSLTRANMHWITDTLATGGDLPQSLTAAVNHISDWIDGGVTHVIDMRMEWDDLDLVSEWAPDIQYLHNPSNDIYGYKMPQVVFDRGVFFAREAEASGGKVLAHCHMGINRGPSMAMAILLDRGMDPIESLELIKERRPIAYAAYAIDALLADCRRRKAEGRPHPDAIRALHKLRAHIKQTEAEDIRKVTRNIKGIRAQEGGTTFS